jgi:hypothetical protein
MLRRSFLAISCLAILLPVQGLFEQAPKRTKEVQDLGLKLEGRKAPIEVLVIDHIEKSPTGN